MRIFIITRFLPILFIVGCQISTDERRSETAEMPTNDIAKSDETYPCAHCDGSGRRVNQFLEHLGNVSPVMVKAKLISINMTIF